MNTTKQLPEPAISCYDDLYLATIVVEASNELKTRGWRVAVSLVAPHSKSVAKRVAIQTETAEEAWQQSQDHGTDSKGRSILDDPAAVIPGNQRD